MAGSSRRHRQRKPARQALSKEPRRRILVVCEGEVTEPQYLDGFKRWCRNPLVDVEIAEGHGVPRTLVERARSLKSEATRAAKAQKDSFLSYDEVWCVFDVDEHPRLDEALSMAAGNGIEIALSNPCFELWLLLHFRDGPGARDSLAMQRMVASEVPGYGKHVAFKDFEGGYHEAVRRAKRLDEAAAEAGEAGRNPTTGVFRLTEAIRTFAE